MAQVGEARNADRVLSERADLNPNSHPRVVVLDWWAYAFRGAALGAAALDTAHEAHSLGVPDRGARWRIRRFARRVCAIESTDVVYE